MFAQKCVQNIPVNRRSRPPSPVTTLTVSFKIFSGFDLLSLQQLSEILKPLNEPAPASMSP